MEFRGRHGAVLAAALAGTGLTADLWRRTHPAPAVPAADVAVINDSVIDDSVAEPAAGALPQTATAGSSLDMIKTSVLKVDDPPPDPAAAVSPAPAPQAAPPPAATTAQTPPPAAPTGPLLMPPTAKRDFRPPGLVSRRGFELRHVQTTGPATTSAVAKLPPPLAPEPPPAAKPAPAPAPPKAPVKAPKKVAAMVPGIVLGAGPAHPAPPQPLPKPGAAAQAQQAIQVMVAAVRVCTNGAARQRTHAPVLVFAEGHPQAGELAQPVRRDYWCEAGQSGTRLWFNQTKRRCYENKECCENGGGACSTPTQGGPFVRMLERRADL